MQLHFLWLYIPPYAATERTCKAGEIMLLEGVTDTLGAPGERLGQVTTTDVQGVTSLVGIPATGHVVGETAEFDNEPLCDVYGGCASVRAAVLERSLAQRPVERAPSPISGLAQRPRHQSRRLAPGPHHPRGPR
ncbi:hypothetical protein GCM10009535_07750 [Streptomyces thermocarboxydovorans]|uniref:Uncharacterized protein n=1 Tax=Streptomyces thermocarboxydovorans TaxID=59298 RepID=A0ABN1HAR0_9ACTN